MIALHRSIANEIGSVTTRTIVTSYRFLDGCGPRWAQGKIGVEITPLIPIRDRVNGPIIDYLVSLVVDDGGSRHAIDARLSQLELVKE